MQRDFFERILGISIDYKLNMAEILSYPITPIPLSMCHIDEAICRIKN